MEEGHFWEVFTNIDNEREKMVVVKEEEKGCSVCTTFQQLVTTAALWNRYVP